MTDPKSKEFLALQAEWYGKLKKSGFEDIEQDEDHLKQWASSIFRSKGNPVQAAAKEEYYRMANHFLTNHSFTDKKERVIWELHAEGVGIESIVKRMRKKSFKVSKNYVQVTVSRLSKVMAEYAKQERINNDQDDDT